MDLMRYLPWRIYHDQEHVADFQQAIGGELDALIDARDDLYLQFRPSTADWGLALFEEEYGIPTDHAKLLEQRLTRWRIKRRGRGTSTSAVLEALAAGLTGCHCDLVEYPEEDYFDLIVHWEAGAPPDLLELLEVIEELKPAHLGVVHRLRSNIVGTVFAMGAEHRHIRRHAPLDYSIPAPPRAEVFAAGTVHQRIRNSIGGIENAPSDD